MAVTYVALSLPASRPNNRSRQILVEWISQLGGEILSRDESSYILSLPDEAGALRLMRTVFAESEDFCAGVATRGSIAVSLRTAAEQCQILVADPVIVASGLPDGVARLSDLDIGGTTVYEVSSLRSEVEPGRGLLGQVDQISAVSLERLRLRRPDTHEQLKRVMERLCRAGVLIRTTGNDGVVEYGLSALGDLRHLGRWSETGDLPVNRGPFRIRPSVLVPPALAALLLGFLTQGMIFVGVGFAIFFAMRHSGRTDGPVETAPKSDPPALDEARAIRGQILQDLKTNRHHPLGKETTVLIDTLIKHMEDLVTRDREIARVLSAISEESIQTELHDLQQRHQQATDPGLKNELARSVEEYQGQLGSYRDLESRREIGSLRLTAAVATLRKIRLDSARIESLSPTRADLDLDELRRRSAELSQYVDDMEQGYRDLT